MKIIGITGGVGCGKSAVLEYIEKNYNAYIAMTDNIAHDLQKPKEVCYEKIVELFGRHILDKDGIIDRKKLGEIIFSDNEKRKQINNIVHPQVTKRLEQLICENRNKKDIFIIESALLLESHIDEICDEIWYIYTNSENRVLRLKSSRGYDDEKIKNIMKSQYSETVFFASCDRIIDNNREIEYTYKQIREELAWLDNLYCPNS